MFTTRKNFEKRFISRKHNNNHSRVQRTHRPTALVCTILGKLSSSFYAIKKDQPKAFYFVVRKIDKVFLYHVYLLNYQNRFYICGGLYLRALRRREVNRVGNMILNSRRESFSKTGMFFRTFQKLPQNVQQK